MNLNPKVLAALVVALVAAAANVAVILADAYPDSPVVQAIAAAVTGLAPVVAGYLKSSGDWAPKA